MKRLLSILQESLKINIFFKTAFLLKIFLILRILEWEIWFPCESYIPLYNWSIEVTSTLTIPLTLLLYTLRSSGCEAGFSRWFMITLLLYTLRSSGCEAGFSRWFMIIDHIVTLYLEKFRLWGRVLQVVHERLHIHYVVLGQGHQA